MTDAPAFIDVMAGLRVPGRRGRTRTGPDVVLADEAYSSRAMREHLRKRGIRAAPPSRQTSRVIGSVAVAAVPG
ncbi:hypothetical protein ACIPRU_18935 [Streptomyces sp. NPDC090126]|uniref:hypothetical protein n=1 Tax=Streptomyces sp. NPDC090126 TaxID=3365952 RepID=UPI003825C68D